MRSKHIFASLKPLLRFPEGPFPALDPCCRDDGLSVLIEGTCGRAYGVAEAGDESILGDLRRRFHRIILGPWDHAQVARSAFSVLYLMPEQSHHLWLRQTWRCLIPGGLLILVVPPGALTAADAGFLCDRFTNVVAGTLAGCLVVLGVRKARLRGDLGAERALRKALKEPPPLPEDIWFSIPEAEPEVRPFVPGCLTAGEAQEVAAASPLWKTFRRPGSGELGRPPVPLHAGHVALLLAAGHLDGAVGEGQDRHLVRGSVEKFVLPVEVEGGDRSCELHTHRAVVSVLLPGGVLKVLR